MRHALVSAFRARFVAASALVAVVVVALCACTVGPDFRTPEVTSVTTYTANPQPSTTEASAGPAGVAQHFVPADLPGDGWWRAFGSPALDALVQQALDDSPTLAQARAK